ncbi:MAG: hypothetical protein RIC55_22120 [Pirellulaceae bacterium]
MKTILKSFVLVALALVVAAPLSAADEKKADAKKPAAKKPAEGKRDGGGQVVNAVLKKFAAAELSDDQVAKIKEIAKEYAPKLAAVRQKQGLSKDQQAAMKAAREKAQADGLKGKAAAEAVAKAVELSDDQKAARAEIQELTAAFNKAALAVLSAEQQAKVAPKRGANKDGAKKPAKKKAAADK